MIGRKLTYDFVKNYIDTESKSGCILISKEYIGNNIKLILKCKCNETFEVSFSEFKDKHRQNCAKCSSNYHMNTNEVIEYVSIHAPTYKLLDYSMYKNGQSTLLFECDQGHQYMQKWMLFKNGHRCSKCHKIKLSNQFKIPELEVLEYFESRNFNFISWETKYVNQLSKVNLKCAFGHSFTTDTASLKNKLKMCPKCRLEKIKNEGSPKRLAYEFVKNFVEVISKSNYKLLSENYKNTNLKLSFECDKGHCFNMSFSDFKNEGSRCPSCKLSKGEKEIRELFIEYRINYKEQYSFVDCVNVYPLPFDFAVFNEKNELIGIVEYDGIQHFEPVEYFGGVEKFAKGIKNDKIKSEYCIKHNIFLLRIPYWDFNNIHLIIKTNFKDFLNIAS